jgi:hypothetical protein
VAAQNQAIQEPSLAEIIVCCILTLTTCPQVGISDGSIQEIIRSMKRIWILKSGYFLMEAFMAIYDYVEFQLTHFLFCPLIAVYGMLTTEGHIVYSIL